MAERTILILGGAQAGPTAASRARELDENARIILIERSSRVSYAVGGLAYHLSGEVQSLEDLDREKADLFRDVYGIDVRTDIEATHIDPKRRLVTAGGQEIGFDALIYALGAESLMPEVLGGAPNVVRFRTLGDLEAIVARLDAGAKHVAVVGGGFFGVEAADGLLRRKCEVTVLEHGSRILSGFSPTVSAMCAEALRRMGARVLVGAEIASVQKSGDDISALVLSSGERLAVDLVVAAAGIRPRSELLAKAGAKVLADGSISVDRRMRTSLSGIYACGVSVAVEHAVGKKRALLAQAAIADKTAQIAGANAAGAKLQMSRALGTAIVRAGHITCARTGISPGERKGTSTVRIHAPSHDAWFPASRPISLELHFDPRTGRVLGADLAGEAGVDKRVDVLGTAIYAGLTIDDLAELDLAYAPPYSAARDPVNVAATVAQSPARVRAWAPAELAKQQGAVTLVDVRTCSERAFEGALPIPLTSLRSRLDELRAKKELVFIDDTGRAGYLAACVAAGRGLPSPGYLSGGLRSFGLEEGRS